MRVPSFLRFRFLWVLFLVGCTSLGTKIYEAQFGEEDFSSREVATLQPHQVDYWTEVKPVLENRCVVCHGCYDAPCQLKLSSLEGIQRGGSREMVYEATRLQSADLSRLHVDAHSVADWRDRDFHSVINEFGRSEEANRAAGVMYQLLEMRKENPLPLNQKLSGRFDLSIDNANSCPSPDTISDYRKNTPQWGMPYGLPDLSENEYRNLTTWLEQGAIHTPAKDRVAKYQAEIDKWEVLLNQLNLKSQVISRYIYEHIYLMNIYFADIDHEVYFKLVRSKTPPGQPVDIVATRRPFDDPGVDRVYYRFVEEKDTILFKAHIPYRLDNARMKRWKELFWEPDYQFSKRPSYKIEEASNPFIIYDEMPVDSRYRFLLDDAQLFIMGFIKGPVCRGQVALNVIEDRFWVFFIDPEQLKGEDTADFLHSQRVNLDLPAEKDSDLVFALSAWADYAEKQQNFLDARGEFIAKEARKNEIALSEDMIWDGDKRNQNAALTIFRHFDSASVETGLIGPTPKTAWFIDYSLFERIHYLLVAGFDVYGNVGHQIITRIYMDFLRMEGELNFLSFLPEEDRIRLRDEWYDGASSEVMDYMTWSEETNRIKRDFDFKTGDTKEELLSILKSHLGGAYDQNLNLEQTDNTAIRINLSRLQGLRGDAVQLMPQTSILRIQDGAKQHLFTILKDNAHKNLSNLLLWEEGSREYEKDSLVIVKDIIAGHPNSLYSIDISRVDDFVGQFLKLKTEEDFEAFRDQFGVRRMSPEFWANSDQIHQAFRQSRPLYSGLLDYNRLENR